MKRTGTTQFDTKFKRLAKCLGNATFRKLSAESWGLSGTHLGINSFEWTNRLSDLQMF
jgi:hypothetical protein